MSGNWVKLWNDVSMPKMGSILPYSPRNFSKDELQSGVNSFVVDTGGWDCCRLSLSPLHSVCHFMVGVHAPVIGVGDDVAAWAGGHDGVLLLNQLIEWWRVTIIGLKTLFRIIRTEVV